MATSKSAGPGGRGGGSRCAAQPAEGGLVPFSADDLVGVALQERVDHGLQQAAYEIRRCVGQASPSRPAGTMICGAFIVMLRSRMP